MSDLSATFSEWFGVSGTAGRLAATLYAANGQVVRHDDLRLATGQTLKGFNRSLKGLRAAMEPESIINVHGHGYWLSDVGMADCEAALADARRRGIAA